MTSLYTDQFYNSHKDLTRTSANRYASMLLEHFQPRSVVDVGCGRGIWLSVFGEQGAQRLVGFDGSWNQPGDIVDPKIEYHAVNLTQPVQLNEKFDLAISVEVAEHLPKSADFGFVESLTGLADVVIFSAAFVQQGGVGHVNETYHSEWAQLFSAWGYDVYDIFRAQVWEDDSVAWWYQQNTFLYVNQQHSLTQLLQQKNIMPVKNTKFMNCVHPYLYAQKLQTIDFKENT